MSTSDPQDRPAPTGPVPPSSDEAARRHAQARPLPTPPDPEPEHRLPPPRFTSARSTRPEELPPTPLGPAATGVTPVTPAPLPAGTVASVPTGTVPGSGPVAGPGSSVGTPAPRPGVTGTTDPAGPAHVPGGSTPTGVTARVPAAADDDDSLFPDPNAPRRIGAGTHVLGLLVGLLLSAVAALVTLLGVSRILSVEADGWVARVEVLGIVMVALGALLLGAVALLSLWTPWVGYTGGALLTLAGGVALVVPGVARTAMLDVVSAEGWQPTVVQTSVAATSGTLVVVGVLVLASGVVSHVARRHGIHLGAFRERNSH